MPKHAVPKADNSGSTKRSMPSARLSARGAVANAAVHRRMPARKNRRGFAHASMPAVDDMKPSVWPINVHQTRLSPSPHEASTPTGLICRPRLPMIGDSPSLPNIRPPLGDRLSLSHALRTPAPSKNGAFGPNRQNHPALHGHRPKCPMRKSSDDPRIGYLGDGAHGSPHPTMGRSSRIDDARGRREGRKRRSASAHGGRREPRQGKGDA